MAGIQKRGDTYTIFVSCGLDVHGKQIKKTMSWKPADGMTEKQIKRELERQKALFEERCRNGLVLDGSTKFADFIETWFENYAVPQLRPTTVETYRFLSKRVIEGLGHIRLDRLQPHHINQFVRKLSGGDTRDDDKRVFTGDFRSWYRGELGLTQSQLSKLAHVSESTLSQVSAHKRVATETAEKIAAVGGEPVDRLFQCAVKEKTLSPRTIQHYYRFISVVLATAVEWQAIPSNPADRVKAPRIPRIEAAFLDERQAAHLLELLDELPEDQTDFQVAVAVLLLTGLRRGELLGLHWSDIDSEKGTIDICRTSKYVAGRGVFEDDTKTTASHRTFKPPTAVFDLLKRYKIWNLQRRLLAGDQWHQSDIIFTSWDGTPMRPDTLTSRFQRWIEQTDLPRVHLHSLRHTNATLLIANGNNVRTVAARLGHSTTTTTLTTYAHAIQSADAAAAESIEIFNDYANTKKA